MLTINYFKSWINLLFRV